MPTAKQNLVAVVNAEAEKRQIQENLDQLDSKRDNKQTLNISFVNMSLEKRKYNRNY